MSTIELEKFLAEPPLEGKEEYLVLFGLWKTLNDQFLASSRGAVANAPPMDANLDALIIEKLTPLERRLYDLPQQDHLGNEEGMKSGDLSPRCKHLTTILMARNGRRIDSEWARLG